MTNSNTEADDVGGAIGSIVGRLIVGAIAWALGTAALVALVALSAIPYGGGSVAPLIGVIPWTVVVFYWVVKPLGRMRLLSAKGVVFAVAVMASCATLGGINWFLGSGERERIRAEGEFAKAMKPHLNYFGKLCANAGAKVFRQVKDVEGFTVYGLRQKPADYKDLIDKNFAGDVYSQIDTSLNPEEHFVGQFLTKLEWEALWYTPSAYDLNRYAVIEIPAISDGLQGFYRFTDASLKSHQKFNRSFVKTSTTAYAVRIEDISSAADRDHWIAGTKWSVVDIATKEVLGEFLAYAMDPLQGQNVFKEHGNGGSPSQTWRRAGDAQYRLPGVQHACPEKDTTDQRKLNSLDFVRSVLVPKRQDVRIIPAK